MPFLASPKTRGRVCGLALACLFSVARYGFKGAPQWKQLDTSSAGMALPVGYVIAHSHGGQVPLYVVAQGLEIRNLLTTKRSDMSVGSTVA